MNEIIERPEGLEIAPGDIIVVVGKSTRAEGMLLTVDEIASWGVRAFAQLPEHTTETAFHHVRDTRQAYFRISWGGFLTTGGKNPLWKTDAENEGDLGMEGR